jgi:peptidoglycan/LPS O-acetylase OafA/YrhL
VTTSPANVTTTSANSTRASAPPDAAAATAVAPPSETRRLDGITGLRAVAALCILLFHVWIYAGPDTTHGTDLGPFTRIVGQAHLGVPLLFVLSGFLLFRPFAGACIKGKPFPSVRAYLTNRALRILPAYWVILLCVALFLQQALLSHPEHLLVNTFFVQTYDPDTIFTGIVPAWSLCVQAVFYLSLPLFGLAAITLARRSRRRTLGALVPVAALAGFGFVGMLLLRVLDGGALRVYSLSFPTRAHWFALGMALALLRVRWEAGGRLGLPSWWRPGAAAITLALIVVSIVLDARHTIGHVEHQTVLALGCVVLLALVVFPPEGKSPWYLRVLGSRALVAVGLVSYSLFLWHDPFVRAFRDAGVTMGGPGGFVANLLLILAVSLALSAITYRLVEVPALRYKRTATRGDGRRTGPEAVGSLEPRDLKAPS